MSTVKQTETWKKPALVWHFSLYSQTFHYKFNFVGIVDVLSHKCIIYKCGTSPLISLLSFSHSPSSLLLYMLQVWEHFSWLKHSSSSCSLPPSPQIPRFSALALGRLIKSPFPHFCSSLKHDFSISGELLQYNALLLYYYFSVSFFTSMNTQVGDFIFPNYFILDILFSKSSFLLRVTHFWEIPFNSWARKLQGLKY